MADLEIVDGDNDPHYRDRRNAQFHFEEFVIFLIRSLASGQASYQVVQNLLQFAKVAGANEFPIQPIVTRAVASLHERGFARNAAGFEDEDSAVIRTALGVLAESMSTDSAAKARRSKRIENFSHAIKEYILCHEERSREHGRSFLRNLLKGVEATERARKKKKNTWAL